MAETHPVGGPRPVAAPPYEPVVRLGTPSVSAAGGSYPNHPVLLPEPDTDDEIAPSSPSTRPAPPAFVKPHWYRALARPTAYIASGIGGAVLVTVLYGILGSRAAATGGRAGSGARDFRVLHARGYVRLAPDAVQRFSAGPRAGRRRVAGVQPRAQGLHGCD